LGNYNNNEIGGDFVAGKTGEDAKETMRHFIQVQNMLI
jgi:hypothetical protein